jgi:ubiquinone/menaquinone biosynthesis C-methylase UbiE
VPDISEYDKLDYDYSSYWTQRVYENLAEKNILNKIFSGKRGEWFLDVGGSYGRLTSTYATHYKNPIIIDYSLKTLQRNRDLVKSKYPNVELIAANAYKMPFKQGVFDGALMVRVLHHIEKPAKYLEEARRVLKNNSYYIQEFANKVHIKAKMRAIFKFNFDFFSKKPYEQPIGTHLEGSQKEEGGIFLNYHPKYIQDLLESFNFDIKRKYGSSFLRSPIIKKLIGTELMLFLEKLMQNTLSWTNIPPSIFLETQLKKRDTKERDFKKLKEILACPSCKKDLTFESDNLASCKNCSTTFSKKEGVWDFRVK